VNADRALNPTRRVAYAFVGLLGGNAALLLFLLQNAMRLRSSLLGMHMGEPARQIPIALQLFVLYARLSFVGWLLELERNLQDLSERLKRGAYRAKPVRRVYIPKADGRQRPLGVTALEDKIVQRAAVEVLNAIYETDFRTFSPRRICATQVSQQA
jgi:hypothetical protein